MAPEPVTFWCSPKDVRHQESVPCSAGFFKLFYPKWNGDMRISASIPLPGHPAVSELGILWDARWYRGGCTMVLWAVLVLSTTFLFIKTTKKRQKDLLIMWNNLYNGAFEIFWGFFLVGRVLNENKTALLEFWISYWETVWFYFIHWPKWKKPNLHPYWWCDFISTNRAATIFFDWLCWASNQLAGLL